MLSSDNSVTTLGINWSGIIGQIATIFGGHPAGTTAGRSTAQSVYATMRTTQALLRATTIQNAITNQRAIQASGFAPGERTFELLKPGVSKQTTQIGMQIRGLLNMAATARTAKRSARDFALAQRATFKKAAIEQTLVPEVTTFAQYGIASGGPIRGSRDDPAGARPPAMIHSLFLT